MLFSLNGVRFKRWFAVIFVLLAVFATVILAVWLSLSFNSQGQGKINTGKYSLAFSEDNLNNEFFGQFGLKALSLVNKKEVQLPEKDDAVFSKYINAQKEQGFDTAKYCQKDACLYVYSLETDKEDKVYAELLVAEEKVIGAHLTDFVYGNEPEPLISK